MANPTVEKQRTNLLDLPDELLSRIYNIAIQYEPRPKRRRKMGASNLIQERYQKLLGPMRACRRLYEIARYEFLEVNTIPVVLKHCRQKIGYQCDRDAWPQAARGELKPGAGSNDAVMKAALHLEVGLPVGDKSPLELKQVCQGLRWLVDSCPHLRIVHFHLYYNQIWIEQHKANFLSAAKGVAETIKTLRVGFKTVGTRCWDGGAAVEDWREGETGKMLLHICKVPEDDGGQTPIVRV